MAALGGADRRARGRARGCCSRPGSAADWCYAVLGLGLAASLAGPLAYTLTTVSEGHSGSIVTAGPRWPGGRGGPGGGGPGGGERPGGGRGGGMQPPGQQGQGQGQARQGNAPQGNGQQGGGPGGGMGGQPPTGGQGQGPGQAQGQTQRGGTGERAGGMGGGGMGGLLNGATVGPKAKAKLLADADDYTWVAAAIGSQNSASYQLATEKPVMAIGGFNGSDPSPTPAQFKAYVEAGKIHYFIASSGGGMGGESSITTWVEANFEKVTVDGATLYDLTQKK